MKLECKNCKNEIVVDSKLEDLIDRYLNLKCDMVDAGIKMENLFILIDRSDVFGCCDKPDYIIEF